MTNIRIKKIKNLLYLEVNGHSNYAERGYDIVCASISTLCQYFLNCEIKAERMITYNIEENVGHLSMLTSINEYNETNIEVFINSLLDIEEQYVKYVEVEMEYE